MGIAIDKEILDFKEAPKDLRQYGRIDDMEWSLTIAVRQAVLLKLPYVSIKSIFIMTTHWPDGRHDLMVGANSPNRLYVFNPAELRPSSLVTYSLLDIFEAVCEEEVNAVNKGESDKLPFVSRYLVRLNDDKTWGTRRRRNSYEDETSNLTSNERFGRWMFIQLKEQHLSDELGLITNDTRSFKTDPVSVSKVSDDANESTIKTVQVPIVKFSNDKNKQQQIQNRNEDNGSIIDNESLPSPTATDVKTSSHANTIKEEGKQPSEPEHTGNASNDNVESIARQALNNVHISITGAVPEGFKNRKEWADFVTSHGGIYDKTPNKDTDYIVYDGNKASEKLDKARLYNVRVIAPPQFNEAVKTGTFKSLGDYDSVQQFAPDDEDQKDDDEKAIEKIVQDMLDKGLKDMSKPSIHFNVLDREPNLFDTVITGKSTGLKYYNPANADKVPDEYYLLMQVNFASMPALDGINGFNDNGLMQIFAKCGTDTAYQYDPEAIFIRFIHDVPSDESTVNPSETAQSPVPDEDIFGYGDEWDSPTVYDPYAYDERINVYCKSFDGGNEVYDMIRKFAEDNNIGIEGPNSEYDFDDIIDYIRENDILDSYAGTDNNLKIGGFTEYVQYFNFDDDRFNLIEYDDNGGPLEMGDGGIWHVILEDKSTSGHIGRSDMYVLYDCG